MVAKGKSKRRRAAKLQEVKGGKGRLPPPPVAAKLGQVSAGLRRLMEFKKAALEGKKPAGFVKGPDTGPAALVAGQKSTGQGSDKTKKTPKEGSDKGGKTSAAGVATPGPEKKRRREANFDKPLEKPEKKRKLYLEKKKAKKKRKAPQEGDEWEQAKRVEFGDIVQAPPKLNSKPRGKKAPGDQTLRGSSDRVVKAQPDPHQERLRLQAIDAYRERKGWKGRPGTVVPAFQALVET